MASDVFHPSFPGGRSGSLRDRVGGSFGAQSSSLHAGHSCDVREKPGAGDGFPSTEYLRLEGVISSKGAEGGAEGGAEASMSRPDESSKGAKNGHPSACEAESNPSSRPNADKAERMILSELADAVAFGAKVHRANELRDAMYLSVVARHCSLGVPLIPEVEAFRSRGSSRGSAFFGGSSSGRVGGGGARRTGAHDRKIARLVRECLPAGADELIERHIDRIISDVEAFGPSDDLLAEAYRKSASFGYFLQSAATRLALEHSFQATQAAGDESGPGDDDEEHARRLREDGYELVSNISSLPAYPSSIGDWIAEDGDDVDDEESDPAILEARARRRREAEATFRAQATHAKAEATSRARADPESTSAAAGADELELDGGCESFGGPEDALERARETRRERQWRRAVGGAYPDRPLAAFPSSIGDWVAPSPSGADDAEYDEPFYEKPIFDLCDDEAAPNLRAFVDAMEPTLRASLATIGQVDVAAVLDSHVSALFHGDVRSGAGAGAGGEPEADVVSFDPRAFSGDLAGGLSRGLMPGSLMPLDGMRYMVVEACAFGASLWSAERRCERYELTRRSVDGAKDQSESRR